MRTKRMGGLVHRQSKRFRIIERRGRYYIECLLDNHKPRTLRVGRDVVREFDSCISDREFDSACIFTGCGVTQ